MQVTTNPKSKNVAAIIQLLLWLCFGSALFLSQPLSWGIHIPTAFWVKQGLTVVLLIVAYYINSRLLVPQLLLKNKEVKFLIVITILAAGVIVLNILIDTWLHIPDIMEAAFRHHDGPPGLARPPGRSPGPPPPNDHGGPGPGRHGPRLDMFTLTITALILGVSTSVTAVQKWQQDNQLHQEMKQQRTESELSFLKAQINPHFFFNTLNNIYMLTMIDVESSRQALHKLSRMMRYLLYETQQDTTLLSKEVDFIKDYIELMRLRLTEKVTLTFEEPARLQEAQIAPMLFLPFVENAFKHGISSTQNSMITIQLKQEGHTLGFDVSNTIVTDQEKTLDGNSGIGLVNTRRRLDLLYAGKYQLNINTTTESNMHYVHLNLQLS
ncbi:sensor histidine kinase [Mucilaginibacter sp.]